MNPPPPPPEQLHPKLHTKLRTRLLTPFIYVAALLLLLEEWLWNVGLRAVSAIAAWPPMHALELRIRALRPYPALCIFVLPAVMLFPIKIMALFAITQGHAIVGVSVIVATKLGGAAMVARLYTLTRPTLVTLSWFERWHDRFVAFKRHWVGRLKESDSFRHGSHHARRLHGASKNILARLRAQEPIGGRHSSHPARVVRRLLAMWRARR